MFKRVLFAIVSVFSFTLHMYAAVGAVQEGVVPAPAVVTSSPDEIAGEIKSVMSGLLDKVEQQASEQKSEEKQPATQEEAMSMTAEKELDRLFENLHLALEDNNQTFVEDLVFEIFSIIIDENKTTIFEKTGLLWSDKFCWFIKRVGEIDFNQKKLLLNGLILYITQEGSLRSRHENQIIEYTVHDLEHTLARLYEQNEMTDYLDAFNALVKADLVNSVTTDDTSQFASALKNIRNNQVKMLVAVQEKILPALVVALNKHDKSKAQKLVHSLLEAHKHAVMIKHPKRYVSWRSIFSSIIDTLNVTDFNARKLLIQCYIAYVKQHKPQMRFATGDLMIVLFKTYGTTDYLNVLLEILQELFILDDHDYDKVFYMFMRDMLGEALFAASVQGNAWAVNKLIAFAENNKILGSVLAWRYPGLAWEYKTRPSEKIVRLSAFDVALQKKHEAVVTTLKEAVERQRRTTYRYAIAQLFGRVCNMASNACTRASNWLSSCCRRARA